MPPDDEQGRPRVTRLGRRLACRNSRFNVWFDHIRDPATGTEVPDFLVVEPFGAGDDAVGGVGIVPVLDGSVVLLRTFRHPIAAELVEIPGGFVDPGEEPAAAALRELAEETGFVCPPEALVPLGFCYPEAGVLRARIALFAATSCRPDPTRARDAGEIGMGAMLTVPLADLPALLRDGAIEDAVSALALHRYAVMSPPTA